MKQIEKIFTDEWKRERHIFHKNYVRYLLLAEEYDDLKNHFVKKKIPDIPLWACMIFLILLCVGIFVYELKVEECSKEALNKLDKSELFLACNKGCAHMSALLNEDNNRDIIEKCRNRCLEVGDDK